MIDNIFLDPNWKIGGRTDDEIIADWEEYQRVLAEERAEAKARHSRGYDFLPEYQVGTFEYPGIITFEDIDTLITSRKSDPDSEALIKKLLEGIDEKMESLYGDETGDPEWIQIDHNPDALECALKEHPAIYSGIDAIGNEVVL